MKHEIARLRRLLPGAAAALLAFGAGKKKTTIGGQALIEGIMMKGPKKTCKSVRRRAREGF